MTEQQVFEAILPLIAKKFPKATNITMDTRIMKDLGADSLDMLDVVTDVERMFKIEMTDEEVLEVVTIGDACKVVKNYL